MFIKSLMKNPILIIGILFFIIFLFNLQKKGYFSERSEKLKATSCRAALVKLNKVTPRNWESSCEKNSIKIEVTIQEVKNIKLIKEVLYRELANSLSFIAKNSPSDNLERTDYIIVKIKYKNHIINSLTKGKQLVKLSSLKNIKLIKDHLKQTVQVQEVFTE